MNTDNRSVTRYSNIRSMLGTIKLPLFLVLWSLSLIVVFANVRTADAAMMAVNFGPWSAQPIPSFDELLEENLAVALKKSDLITGTWQPTSQLENQPVEVSLTAEVIVEQISSEIQEEVGELVVVATRTKQLNIASVHEITNPVIKSPVVVSEIEKPMMSKRPVDTLAKTKGQARQYMASGQPDLAYELLRSELANAREDKEYLGLTAVAAIRSERMLDASILYERLTELQPEEARWWAGLGVCQEVLGLTATFSFQKAQSLVDSWADSRTDSWAESGSVLDDYLSLRTATST